MYDSDVSQQEFFLTHPWSVVWLALLPPARDTVTSSKFKLQITREPYKVWIIASMHMKVG